METAKKQLESFTNTLTLLLKQLGKFTIEFYLLFYPFNPI